MKINITTKYNKGHSWTSKNGVYFIGYFFQGVRYTKGIDAVNYFSNCTSFDSFLDLCKGTDGIFSIIIERDGVLWAASDKSRFFPLFYRYQDRNFIISDDFYAIIEKSRNDSIDTLAKIEFLSHAITCNNRTLIDNIKQVRPCDAIEFKQGVVQHKYFYSYATSNNEYFQSDYDSLKKEAYSKFELSSERLHNSLEGKEVLLPLSSGFDSRLIASWLKKSGIDNVLCFTFGRKGAPEIDTSKRVAKKLGYKWLEIEYNDDLIKGYKNDGVFTDYFKYLSRGTNMFYLQEYFAVKWLNSKDLIGTNHIAIPGHAGGFIAGNNLVRGIPYPDKSYNEAAHLADHYFNLIPITKNERNLVYQGIKAHINELRNNKETSNTFSLLEDWLLKERISKYLFSSAHAFTFYNMEVRFPFWDDTLFEFWRKVPGNHRCYKRLFKDVLDTYYFKPLGISQKVELQPRKSEVNIQNIKNKLRPYLPLSIKHKFVDKNDWAFYKQMTLPLLDDLNREKIEYKDNGTSYFYRILYWYCMKLEEMIRK